MTESDKILKAVRAHILPSVSGRHIHRMNNLLETIINDLSERPLFACVFDNFIQTLKIILSVVLLYEIVKVHEVFRSGYGAEELTTNGIHQIYELSAE